MLWFLLFGLIGYCIYKVFKHYRYKALLKKVMQYQDIRYKSLSPQKKQEVKTVVNAVLDSGTTLTEETNKIVTPLFKDIEVDELYSQGGMTLRDKQDKP